MCTDRKFQRSLALPNVKYNCAVLFLKEKYWLFIYAQKYIFIKTTIVKPSQNFLISSQRQHKVALL